jgi:hypothetical protein
MRLTGGVLEQACRHPETQIPLNIAKPYLQGIRIWCTPSRHARLLMRRTFTAMAIVGAVPWRGPTAALWGCARPVPGGRPWDEPRQQAAGQGSTTASDRSARCGVTLPGVTRRTGGLEGTGAHAEQWVQCRTRPSAVVHDSLPTMVSTPCARPLESPPHRPGRQRRTARAGSHAMGAAAGQAKTPSAGHRVTAPR